MSTLGHALAFLAGIVLVATMVTDAVATLVVTQGRSSWWRPMRIWYRTTWRGTRALAARLPARPGDAVLDAYPAFSLLGLLVLWLVGLLVGWSLVYLGIGARAEGAGDYGSLFYFAGTSLLTPTFGASRQGLPRALSLAETLTGLGTIALMISYLPALYGAYSRRETRLLTLDDPQGGRLTPVRVMAVHAPGGDLDRLYAFFAEWEMWTAEVLESHVSYPMLAAFRSQHAGQSWISALGVVTDAATLTCACVEGAAEREPYFMYRRGRRAIGEIGDRLHLRRSVTADWLNPENFDIAWGALQRTGLPLRSKDQAWSDLVSMRATYGDELERLIDYLLAPRGFWGHSAEHVDAEVARATAEARARARERTPRESEPAT